jgi:hypothetical protein
VPKYYIKLYAFENILGEKSDEKMAILIVLFDKN